MFLFAVDRPRYDNTKMSEFNGTLVTASVEVMKFMLM